MQSRLLLSPKQTLNIGNGIFLCSVCEISYLTSEAAQSAVCVADGECVLVAYAVRATFNINEKQRIPAIPNNTSKLKLDICLAAGNRFCLLSIA